MLPDIWLGIPYNAFCVFNSSLSRGSGEHFKHPNNSCKEMAEFCFKNAQVKSISYCKQRMKSKLLLSSECAKTKLCKLYASFASHLRNMCGMAQYKTLRDRLVGLVTKVSALRAADPRFESHSNWVKATQTEIKL